MVMAIAWNKLSHNQSLHNCGSAYKPPPLFTAGKPATGTTERAFTQPGPTTPLVQLHHFWGHDLSHPHQLTYKAYWRAWLA